MSHVSGLRFLVSRRWVAFAVVVGLLAWLAVLLGQWQFHRLEDRKATNVIVERNTRAAPLPVADVLAPDRAVPAGSQWQRVEATGTYDEANTVVIRYQTRDGASGVDVVTPLVTAQGTALLVDRGWLATANSGTREVDLPATPAGEVTVTGWVRGDATGDSAQVSDASARAISSVEIGATLPYGVFGGFVDLESEDPAPAQPLARTELPETDNGPHFFYGLQWWFFGALAVFGFGYFARDEWRRAARPQRARSIPPSTGSMTPVTNDAAGDSRKAATRPNSVGSP